jgi:hypothetical protein
VSLKYSLRLTKAGLDKSDQVWKYVLSVIIG